MNALDWLLLAAVAAAAGFALRSVLRARKRGGCCGNCASCGGCGAAGQKKPCGGQTPPYSRTK